MTVTAHPDRPLIADRARPLAVLSMLAAAVVLAAFSYRYHGTDDAGRIDNRVHREIDNSPVAHWNVNGIADLGGPVPFSIMIIVLVAILLGLRRWRAAIVALIGPIIAGAVTTRVLKPLVDRTLDGALAFPSGHSTAIFAIAFAAVLALCDRRPPRLPAGLAILLSVVLLIVASSVAAAQVVADRHYTTDVIAGVCVALIAVLGTSFAVDAIAGVAIDR